MTMRWSKIAAAAILSAVVGLVGWQCSGKKVDNAKELTAEEQAELFESTVGPIDSLGTDLSPLILSQIGVNLWNGVDPADFKDFSAFGFGLFGMGGGKIATPGTSHFAMPNFTAKAASVTGRGELARRVHAFLEQASVEEAIKVSYQNGWWVVDVDTAVSETDSSGSASLSIKLKDSVRFENATGNPRPDPDATTDHVRHGSHLEFGLALNMDFDGNPVGLEFDFNAASGVSVAGLTTNTATVNGQAGINVTTIHVDGQVYDSTTDGNVNASVNGTAGFNMALDDVKVPIVGSGESRTGGCPADGLVALGMDIDLTAVKGRARDHAKGSWDLNIDFVGNGQADISLSVAHGDNIRSAEGVVVCSPTE